MNKTLEKIFAEEQIEYFSPLPIEKCRVRRADIIERAGMRAEEVKCAIMLLIPYFVDTAEGNISLYARSRDYHLYCEELFPRLCEKLQAAFGGKFIGFADKSPIEETDAASRAGLGKIGDSYVIINEKYGSFVFIGEILTTVSPDVFGCDARAAFEPTYCDHCGACRRACPMVKEGRECLSALTQKKGELTFDERDYIKRYGSAWGCDICQLACPLVREAIKNGEKTPIKFFWEQRINVLTSEMAENMTDEEFSSRAFAWRGKKTILRNLKIFE